MIVVNTTFRMAPWADALYAMDRAWWSEYLAEVRETFRGALWAPLGGLAGVKRIRFDRQTPRNSGAGAVALAAQEGAERIVLLGYDAQHSGGRTHWHGDHPKGLGNAGSVAKWPEQFRTLIGLLRGATVVNASRTTALACFPRASLEAALNDRSLS